MKGFVWSNPESRTLLMRLARLNYIRYNEARTEQKELKDLPILGEKLNILSMMGVLLCPNDDKLSDQKDDGKAASISMPSKTDTFSLSAGCGIHAELRCTCIGRANCNHPACNSTKTPTHTHMLLPVLSLASVCRLALKASMLPFEQKVPITHKQNITQ
jgi:hypothetical protein